MFTYTSDSLRRSVALHFAAHVGFVLAEAITNGASALGLFLPDSHTDISRDEALSVSREVHGRTRGVRTEVENGGVQTTHGNVGKQRLNGVEVDKGSRV